MSNKVKKCVGKESFQRMNYLYQISNLLMMAEKREQSNFYSNLTINISKKTVQRLDVDIKRTICKGCRSIILPGISCRVRVNKKKLRVTCCLCHTSRIFKLNSNEVLWTQNPMALVENLDYGKNVN